MRFRTWPVAALGLGGLLVLIVVSVLTASRRAQEIYAQLDQLNAHHRNVDTTLRRLRADVHLSGIFIRDYLLDTERERAHEYRERLAEVRSANLATLAELRLIAWGETLDEVRIARLQSQLEEYWEAFNPLFDWTPAERQTESAQFLRREVLPRREAVLEMTAEMEELNNDNLVDQQGEVTLRQEALRSDLYRLLWQSLLLGFLVAVVAVVRLRVLERRSEQQRQITQEAERQMRQLSQQIVAAQEEERKNLSRELHDHVGQMLTALRMELGRIERLRVPSNTRVADAVVESRTLVDNIVRIVRDLALGLRPSMLDDFGLQAAVEWHVRDFTRRYKLPVELTVRGDLDGLPDQYRTCVYRVVQEALTNCVRHSSAHRIKVALLGQSENLYITIKDDGVGIDPGRERSGLGLRGIEERVRELGGTVSIEGEHGSGTTLAILLPLPDREAEVPRARAAG